MKLLALGLALQVQRTQSVLVPALQEQAPELEQLRELAEQQEQLTQGLAPGQHVFLARLPLQQGLIQRI